MYQSNSEFFEAVRNLVADLEESGNKSDAGGVKSGLSHMNGLTDGWAILLESLLKVEESKDEKLTESQKAEVRILCDLAHKAVYRKNRRD